MLKPYSRADIEFDLRDEIGAEGKNSRVFRAYDPQLDAELVIKKVAKVNLAADEFFAESSRLYASAHPNVVPISYACQDSDHVYLAMPFFRKGSLKQLMAKRFLSTREIVVIATQFLSGLHHIHSRRLVHFDIKPDNILISDRGEALVSDFGLTKALGLNGFAQQNSVYPYIAPPEFYGQAEHDARYDIYQAGVTLFRMCIGEAAFHAQVRRYVVNGVLDQIALAQAIVSGDFPETGADVYPEHIPAALVRVIRKCLSSLNDRYRSAIEVVNDLASIDGNLLDWAYTADASGRVWEKQKDGRRIRIAVAPDGSVHAVKGVAGAERRIADYCRATISRQDLKRFLQAN